MLTPFDIEQATGQEPYRPQCYYCGGIFCKGGCAEGVTAAIMEDRRQRRLEEIWDAQDALAIEQKEHQVIQQLHLAEEARVSQEIEECAAEYESNAVRIEKARDAELSDALARSGAPPLESADADPVQVLGK